jgi:hypothetical protein
VVGLHGGRPVYLRDVATIERGPEQPESYVWMGAGPAGGSGVELQGSTPAVTIAVAKQEGVNAVEVAERVVDRFAQLQGTFIPDNVEVTVTRNYGATADAKAKKLISKLTFATALGGPAGLARHRLARGHHRGGAAVVVTLALTLFASWAWGFTLNRVSLFALIFSIGILVDDAIVVVENIHRHMALKPMPKLLDLMPKAVDEVGGPHHPGHLHRHRGPAAHGLRQRADGALHEPHPHQRLHGDADLPGGRLRLHALDDQLPCSAGTTSAHAHAHHGEGRGGRRRAVAPVRPRDRPLPRRPKGNLQPLAAARRHPGADRGSRAAAVNKTVILKMLPFDNKSEFQVVLDMPEGTSLEQTARVLAEMGEYLATVPEVTTTRPMRAPPRPSTSTAWCASTTCARGPTWATSR